MSNFFRPVGFVLGLLIAAMGLAMLGPMAADAFAHNPDWRAFGIGAAGCIFFGVLLGALTGGRRIELDIRQGFLLTVLSWFLLSAVGALPFAVSKLGMDYTDAVFESVSGLTTTGSTVLTGLDRMPPGILMWRAMLQWVGGVGIIVMAIAMLPYLRVGGMQLFRMESSDRSEKVFPRAAQIATATSVAYVVLSITCALLYYFAGMTGFEALTHAMTTLSTGGYATSDSSFGHFENPAIHWIATVFMVMGGLPFVIYIRMAFGQPFAFWKESQVRRLIEGLTVAVLIMSMWLWFSRDIPLADALRLSAFNIVSVVTTTGFASADYSQWGGFAVMAFFVFTFMGACTGSTSGGIKVLRFELLVVYVHNLFRRLCEPRGVIPLRYRNRILDPEVVASAMTFFFLFILVFALLALALSATGVDYVTAISGAATALANVGPGLGETIGPAGNFAPLPDTAKWLLCLGMLLGRLELMTVLVLVLPAFWKP